MKNKKKIIILLLLILSLISLGGVGTKIAIDIEDKKICEVYSEKFNYGYPVNEIKAKLGRYNGACVVFFGHSNEASPNVYNIEHLNFYFLSDNATIYVYKDGEMYDLPVAYEKGLLNINQVAKIQLKYNRILYLCIYTDQGYKYHA